MTTFAVLADTSAASRHGASERLDAAALQQRAAASTSANGPFVNTKRTVPRPCHRLVTATTARGRRGAPHASAVAAARLRVRYAGPSTRAAGPGGQAPRS